MQPTWRRIFQMVVCERGRCTRACRSAVQGGQNRLWPRDALQVLWRGDADLQDALHNGGLGGDGGRFGVPRSRVGMQSQHISGISLAEPPEPLAYEGNATWRVHRP